MIRGIVWNSHSTSSNTAAKGKWMIGILLEQGHEPTHLAAQEPMVLLTQKEYEELLGKLITKE